MQRFKVAVIGGGASGIVAAITARRRGDDIVLCERGPRLGRKVLASGNGRCNLSNESLDETSYNAASGHLVKGILSRFGKDEIASFFFGLGVMLHSEEGRIFPITNQSVTVVRALELELERLSIPVEYGFDIAQITESGDVFTLHAKSGKSVSCGHLIIAAGGKSYPALGSDGSGYALAREFGHAIVDPVPAAVPVVVKSELCHLLQGQKVRAAASAVIDGETAAKADGELLFTKYGLSGTAILDIARPISVALNRPAKKDAGIIIDLVPFMDEAALSNELARRCAKERDAEGLLVGILPNKFGPALRSLIGKVDPQEFAKTLKGMRFKVEGTRGWNEADFTAGGVASDEVSERTLESRLRENIYFAGEILDVDGRRGGYNLAWAWASGYVAGLRGRE